MAREMKFALEAVPENKNLKKWSVLVQVLHSTPVLTSNKDTKYRNYLLVDMNGTKVSAVTFNNHISCFENTLKQYERYIISNAQLSPLEERFRVSQLKYSWVLKNQTPVEPVEDSEIQRLQPNAFNTVPTNELYKYADKDGVIDMKGLIVHKFPAEKQSNGKWMKIYILVDEQKIPILLRLWCERGIQDEHEIRSLEGGPMFVVATDLRVSTFYGLSLNSRYNSRLLEEPPIAGISELKKWYLDNEDEISSWKGSRIYQEVGRFFRPPKEDEIIDLKTAVAHIAKLKTTWVRANIELIQTTTKPWHSMCEHCNRFLDVEPYTRTYCNPCARWMVTDVRTKVHARLVDGTRSLATTITSPDCDCLIHMNPAEVQQAHEKGIDLYTKMTQEIQGRAVVCFIKTYELEYKGERTPRYPVLRMFLDEHLQEKRKETEPEEITEFAVDSPREPAQTTTFATNKGTPQSQLFTPTMGKMLGYLKDQEISEDVLGSPAKGVKRQIQFGTVTQEDINAESSIKFGMDGEVLEETANPSKKMKDKAADVMQ